MKKFILISLCYIFIANANNWITDEDAVILLDQNEFIITTSNTGVFNNHRSIRINNVKAKEFCNFKYSENHYVKINSIQGVIKDTLGNVIKELKSDQIKETSIHVGSTLHSDGRTKYFTLDHFEYPFIVEVSCEKKYSSLFIWPPWTPQDKYPVIVSDYKLVLKKNVTFKTYYNGIDIKPQISKVNNDSVYYWRLDSIPAFPDEPLMAPEDESQYYLLFAPLHFATSGVVGSLESWDTYADWYRKLCRNKYELNREVTYVIDKIIKGVSSDRKKIELIYSYMQEKTRYVAIQLGIGGWQPYSANTVYKNRFGDCKDLSTFMIAALKHAGIKSYPALVLTRDEGIVNKNFPFNYFNHVMNFVPLGNDTIWLENTADYISAGEIPWSREDCSVLAVNESSGQIVKTPISKSSENAWISNIKGELTPQGKFNFSGKVRLSGNQKYSFAYKHLSYKTKDFKDWLISRIGSGIPGFKLDSYNIENVDTLNMLYMELTFKASIKKLGNKTGKRLFVNPNLLNERTGTSFEQNEERKYPIWLNYAYLDIDTVSIQLPYGYKLEAAPKELSVEFPFGKYSSSHEIKDGVFNHYRHFEYTTNLIPADQYEQVVEFTNAAIKKDQAKYVFKKH